MDTQIFKDMGLDEGEAKAYLAMLELGPSLASSVAKKTGIDRSVTYKKLDDLIHKGFASYHIRENRRYFQATDPKELLDLARDREHKLEELLPELRSLQKPRTRETTVQIFKGREGYKAVCNDILRHCIEMGEKTVCGIAYTGEAREKLGVWYDTWTRRRMELGIRRKYLVMQKTVGRYALNQPLTETRLLPRDLKFPSATIVYGRHTLVLYHEGEDTTGIIIDSEGIAYSNKALFEALWRKSGEIKPAAKQKKLKRK